MTTDICGASHRGNVRSHNEDNIYIDGSYRSDVKMDNVLIRGKKREGIHTFAVFDGLGGESCGELASLIAARVMREYKERGWEADTDSYIADAHRIIIRESAKEDSGEMGTTVAAVYTEGSRATVFNVGDSRVYLYREGSLRRLTKDHSVTQTMIDGGILKEEERKNSPYEGQITQYLGMVSLEDIEPSASVTTEALIPGDVLLLCSDGLTAELGDDDIRSIIEDTSERQADYTVLSLVKRATEGKCKDNVSAIICKIDS